MVECVWSVGEIILTWKNGNIRRETRLTATLFSTNLAWSSPGFSPRLRGNRSAMNGRRLTVWGITRLLNESTECRLIELRESGRVQDNRPYRPPSLVTSSALANVLHLSHTERRQNTLSADQMQPQKIAKVHGSPETFGRRMNPKHRKKKDWYSSGNIFGKSFGMVLTSWTKYNRKCTPQTLTELENCTETVLRASLRRVSTNKIRRLCLCNREGDLFHRPMWLCMYSLEWWACVIYYLENVQRI